MYGIESFSQVETDIIWQSRLLRCNLKGQGAAQTASVAALQRATFEEAVAKELRPVIEGAGLEYRPETAFTSKLGAEIIRSSLVNQTRYRGVFKHHSAEVSYLPADRAAAAFLTGNIFRLQSHQVGIVSSLIDFLSAYEAAKEFLGDNKLNLPFLKARFYTDNNRASVQVFTESGVVETALADSASGLQSVAPLAVVAAHKAALEGTASFIIEEPELNLYPTAQQGLLNWLVEKCTKGENDLTITTHSPYLLAHFNLLLYAFQVAEAHPERADEVAKIVPRESWINPKEFAAYHVEGQQENGVRSILNPETGLISYNGLDAIASAETSEFEKLLDINAGLEVE